MSVSVQDTIPQDRGTSVESVRVKLPAAFSPTNPAHANAVTNKVNEAHGGGFTLSHIEGEFAVLVRRSVTTEVVRDGDDSFFVKLPNGTKPTDGDKMAATLQEQHPGFSLTKFDPHNGRAGLTRLSGDEVRCREAVAGVIGAKPWDVTVAKTPDGGYLLGLTNKYVPSKHDDKLNEVAVAVVGRFGWYVEADPAKLTARIIPSDPPTFPEVIPLDLSKLGEGSLDKTPFGMKLPEPGESKGKPAFIDWTMSPYLLLGGLPRSGKFLTHDTLVPAPVSPKFPSGWARHGDLAVGDSVYAVDGSVVAVKSLSAELVDDVFDVVFSDGQIIRAGGDHLWTVSSRRSRTARLQPKEVAKRSRVDAGRAAELRRLRDSADDLSRSGTGITVKAMSTATGYSRLVIADFLAHAGIPYENLPGKGSPRAYPAGEAIRGWADHLDETWGRTELLRQPLLRTVTTRDMLKTCRVEDGRANWAVPVADSLDGFDEDLAVPPYVLGAWLGDGTRRVGAITVGDTDRDEMLAILTDEMGYAPTRSSGITYFWGRPQQGRCLYGHDDWKPVAGYSPTCASCLREGRSGARSNIGLSEKLVTVGAKVDNVKVIPSVYLRAGHKQRLALLQGLMDTDGYVAADGSIELGLCDERLSQQSLELIRSLGFVASCTSSPAAITRPDGSRDVVGTRFRIKFAPSEQVFRLSRKAERLAPVLPARDGRTSWNYVVEVRPAGRAPVRCITVDHPRSLYLVGGFIPTHNSVSLTDIIADALSNGSELVIVDTPDKAVDFTWCKPYVRPGGWGCDGLRSTVTALRLAHEELKRRADILKDRGLENWYQIPLAERPKPLLVVADEVSMLLMTERLPAGVDKKTPEVQEVIERNLMKFRTQKTIYDIMAEMGFVGARVVLASQVTNAATGLPPTMKNLMGLRMLQGSNPSKPQRDQAFNVSASVPLVPENLRGGGQAAKGVGAAEMEGQEPYIYKPFYASIKDIVARLEQLGLPKTNRPEPTLAEMDRLCPVGQMDDEEPEPDILGSDRTPSGKPLDPKYGPSTTFDDDGRPLRGAAAAARASKELAASAPGPQCPSCSKPIQADGTCGCSW